MIIKKYGIELHRLKQEDLELVRHHRNSDAIREKMFFQDEITQEAQEKWFSKINNAYNYYFVVHWKAEKVGLIHGTITSAERKEATGGVFFWDKEFMLTYMPICTSIVMGDLSFILLNMNTSTAVVRTDNERALEYNLKLGYKILKTEGQKTYMVLDKKSYSESELKKLVKRITKDEIDLNWKNIKLSHVELENTNGTMMTTFLDQYKKVCVINA